MAGVVGDNLSREELLTLVRQQQDQIEALLRRVAQLERELAAARKNSSNSSKPPSSDITKPPPPSSAGGQSKRKIGGQPNHPKHERPPFPPNQVDRVRHHRLSRCPNCGGDLSPASETPQVLQQAELVPKPIRITEHRAYAYWCKHCQQPHDAPLPSAVEAAGLLGPRLRAFVAFLKSAGHASFSTVRTFLKDVLGLTVSRGYLAKVLHQVSGVLKRPYDELRQRLPREKALNADETGHKENGRRPWTWCFRAEDFTVYHIADSRGADILYETLGADFRGVLGCDYFSAYRRYLHEVGPPTQFCLAHLIRDVKFLTTLTDRPTRNYGTRLLDALRELFHIVHRREKMRERRWMWRLTDQRERILSLARTRVPHTREAGNLAERFRRHGDAYFEFILSPRIDPTNNRAEQAIRHVVIDRRITQGTRGQTGRNWCERAWSVLATCAQQGRSAFDYYLQAIQHHLTGQPVPSLIA
jgi:transposase